MFASPAEPSVARGRFASSRYSSGRELGPSELLQKLVTSRRAWVCAALYGITIVVTAWVTSSTARRGDDDCTARVDQALHSADQACARLVEGVVVHPACKGAGDERPRPDPALLWDGVRRELALSSSARWLADDAAGTAPAGAALRGGTAAAPAVSSSPASTGGGHRAGSVWDAAPAADSWQLPAPTPPSTPNGPASTSSSAASAAVVDDHGSRGASAPRSPSDARALLVICYNRPDYLRRTLQGVLRRLPRYDRPHILISQDGTVESVAAVIREMRDTFASEAPDVPFEHWQHPQSHGHGDDGFGYMKLARHFGWALDKAFARGHPRVIILEDDLDIGVDFFEYFSAVAPLLDNDDTLLAASAYNDIGFSQYVDDPARIVRSDFFPGLGWMLTAARWRELGPKWPNGYWDDWLREPAQRKGRAILRPEVSRTKTFGKVGVSQSQFFNSYLEPVLLNEQPVDWTHQDLAYLRAPAGYDRALQRAVAGARAVGAHEILAAPPCAPPASSSSSSSSLDGGWGRPGAVKAIYAGVDNYPAVANAFGFISDVKAGVPRTAYKGIVAFKYQHCDVFLVPADT